MDQQTQAFLALISDELTQAVFACLQETGLATTEVAKAVEADSRIVKKQLEMLRVSGLVRRHKGERQGRGRRPVLWERANSEVLEEIEQLVRAARQRLIEAGDGEVEEGVASG